MTRRTSSLTRHTIVFSVSQATPRRIGQLADFVLVRWLIRWYDLARSIRFDEQTDSPRKRLLRLLPGQSPGVGG
jgi:hypothetical protein